MSSSKPELRCRLLDEYAKLALRASSSKPVIDYVSPADWARLRADERSEALRDKSASTRGPADEPQMVLFGGRVIVRRMYRPH